MLGVIYWHPSGGMWWPLLVFLLLLLSVLSAGHENIQSPLRQKLARDYINRTALGTELLPTTRAKAHRVADLMLDVYKTLVDMRYLQPEALELGPHDINVTLCEEHKIDKSIVYLWQILPYLDLSYAEAPGFIFGGTFVDFRDEEHVSSSRDPMYALAYDNQEDCGHDCEVDENGELNLPYMKPTMTTLSNLGNHQCVLVYDVKTDRIWITDQLGGGTCDPALRDIPAGPKLNNNRNEFTHEPSRSAAEVLKDIMKWYHELSEIPGGDGDYGVPGWDYAGFKKIYEKHGWPDSFDGFAFQADLERFRAQERSRYFLDEPRHELEKFQLWRRFSRDDLEKAETALLTPKNADQNYLAKFKLWKSRTNEKRSEENFREAEAKFKRLCPNNECQEPATLRRLEIEHLMNEIEHAAADPYAKPIRRQRRVAYLSQALKDAEAEGAAQNGSVDSHGSRFSGPYDEDSRLARDSVRDQRTLLDLEREIEEVELWLAKAPSDAHTAIEAISLDLGRLRDAHWHVLSRMRHAARWTLKTWLEPSIRAAVMTCPVIY